MPDKNLRLVLNKLARNKGLAPEAVAADSVEFGVAIFAKARCV